MRVFALFALMAIFYSFPLSSSPRVEKRNGLIKTTSSYGGAVFHGTGYLIGVPRSSSYRGNCEADQKFDRESCRLVMATTSHQFDGSRVEYVLVKKRLALNRLQVNLISSMLTETFL